MPVQSFSEHKKIHSHTNKGPPTPPPHWPSPPLPQMPPKMTQDTTKKKCSKWGNQVVSFLETVVVSSIIMTAKGLSNPLCSNQFSTSHWHNFFFSHMPIEKKEKKKKSRIPWQRQSKVLVQHFWLFSRQTDGLFFFLKKCTWWFCSGVGGAGRERTERVTRQRGSVGQHLKGMFSKGTVQPK